MAKTLDQTQSGALPKVTSEKAGAMSLALLGAAAFIVTADTRVVTPLLPTIAHEFHTNIGAAGGLVTAYALPYGLCQLLYGPLGDRVGKMRVMTVAIGMFAMGTALCGLAPNLALLDALRFLTGAVAAALIPLSLAYIGDHFPYAQRQVAISQYLTAIALGNILSTSLGGLVADVVSWRFIFLVYGIVSLGVFGLFLRANARASDGPRVGQAARRFDLRENMAGYGRLLAQPASRLVMMAVAIEGFFFFGGFAYLGAFLKDRYGLPYLAIGLILSGFGIGSLIYSRCSRWLVRRLGETGQIVTGGALVALAYILIVVAPGWPLFTALTVVLGLGFYLIHSTFQTRATELTPEARGSAVSFFAFSLFVGQGIGAYALGVVVDRWSYTPMLLLSGIPVALLGVFYVWRMRSIQPEPLSRDPNARERPLIIGE